MGGQVLDHISYQFTVENRFVGAICQMIHVPAASYFITGLHWIFIPHHRDSSINFDVTWALRRSRLCAGHP